jgi:hypothetical protein
MSLFHSQSRRLFGLVGVALAARCDASNGKQATAKSHHRASGLIRRVPGIFKLANPESSMVHLPLVSELWFKPPHKAMSFMIKNYALARSIRTFALRSAENALAISRSVAQCKKRRVRQPRTLKYLRLTPSQARFAYLRKAFAPKPISHPQQAQMSKTEIVKWFWENNTFQATMYRPHLRPVAKDAVALVDPDMADVTLEELTLGLRISSGEIRQANIRSG